MLRDSCRSEAERLLIDETHEGSVRVLDGCGLPGDAVDLKRSQRGGSEAARRLAFFAHSLRSDVMPHSNGALQAMGLTTLIPIYGEPLLLRLPEHGPPSDGKGRKTLSDKELAFLQSHFQGDWAELGRRWDTEAVARDATGHTLAVRKWASHRWQSVWRTIAGMRSS